MIVVKLKGGLGNQMFQYAAGLAVSLSQGEDLKLDISGYNDPRYIHANTPRVYRMYAFNLSASPASPKEIKDTKYPYGLLSKFMRVINHRILKRHYMDYDPYLLERNSKYLEGYFQSEKNFVSLKNKIVNDFILKKEFESKLFLVEKNNLNKTKSISVHIRRGDYVSDLKTNMAHGVCSMDYYRRAISLMRANIDAPVFYFFSDDIEWVKKEFGESHDFKYISNQKLEDYEELILMSFCVNNIIANSSFSWWGAYLNKNPTKIVISPKKWVNITPDPHPNIIPEGWIKI